tara:strand:- start:93 stop:293 length:201 start_codon:yes stop_codon:yes gene_type:complete
VKQYDDIDPPKESKDEEDMRRHGFIMPRSPEKPMTKKGKAALKEWQEPYQESEDEIDGIGFVIGES